MKTPEGGERSILLEAQGLVYGDRRKNYGHPADDYGRTVRIFKELTGIELTPEQGVLFMVAVKLSREKNRHKRDNIVDAAGYLECYRMVRERHEQSDSQGRRPDKKGHRRSSQLDSVQDSAGAVGNR